MKILIVDDEMEVLTLFKDILESMGHAIEIAIDGEIGIKLVQDTLGNGDAFDLVVMDYRMHGKDGIQVTEEIWAMDDVKILFASGSHHQGGGIGQRSRGFLHNPFNLDELVEEVTHCENEQTINERKWRNAQKTEIWRKKKELPPQSHFKT